MSRNNFQGPEQLDVPEDGQAADELGPDREESDTHAFITLNYLFDMSIRAGRGIAPVGRPPDCQKEQVDRVYGDAPVVGDCGIMHITRDY